MSQSNVTVWAAWPALPAKHRERAARLAGAVILVERMIEMGSAVDAAIKAAAKKTDTSPATLYRARAKVAGVPRRDWLPTLAPRYVSRCGREAKISPAALQLFKELRLGPFRRPLKTAWRDVARIAAREGWAWPSYGTIRSRCIADISAVLSGGAE